MPSTNICSRWLFTLPFLLTRAASLPADAAQTDMPTPAQLKQATAALRSVFDAIDTDGSGFVEKNEIRTIAKGVVGVIGSEEGLNACFKHCELNKVVEEVLESIDGNVDGDAVTTVLTVTVIGPLTSHLFPNVIPRMARSALRNA